MTYNGHDMKEFVPQRTAAYISQHDLHIGEMTVKETLAFSARCQGVGSRYGQFWTITANHSSAACLLKACMLNCVDFCLLFNYRNVDGVIKTRKRSKY